MPGIMMPQGSSWREDKLEIIFSSKDIVSHIDKNGIRQHRIIKRDYVSYLSAAEGFKRLLFTHAVSYGYGDMKGLSSSVTDLY